MSRLVMVAAVLVLVAGVVAPLRADGGGRSVTETVWYQGFLADVATGDPVNGTVTVVATLYDAATVGSILWGPETHAGTVVTEGWFNIELGATVSLVAFINPPYYLELTVAGEILEPRQKLASVPTALRSAAADSGDGDWTIDGTTVYHEVGRVGIGVTVPSGKLHIRDDSVTAVAVTIENQDTSANSSERINFSNEDGSLAYIACYDDDSASYESMMVIANNRPGGRVVLRNGALSPVVLDSTGNVGIGLSSPASKLDVDGTAEMLGFKLTTSPSDGYVLTSDAAGVGTWQAAGVGGDSDWTVAGNDMYSAVSGNVGIGASVPSGKLHVRADVNGSATLAIENQDTGASSAEKLSFRNEDGSLAYIACYDDDSALYSSMMVIANNRPGGRVVLRTGGTTAVMVDSTRNVGIGTATPGSKLDVDGTVEATGLKVTTSPSNGYALTSDASGVATWQPQHLVDVHDEGTPTTIGASATQFDDTEVSLTVPGPGYIICTSTVWIGLNHANNVTADHIQLNHSTSPTDMGASFTKVAHFMLATEPIGSYYKTFSVHSTHTIGSAGTYTYYLVGRMLSGQDAADQFITGQMTAVYYPG
ncbi:hypothetical protein H8D73_02295 [bacterium]|nr:hypothetical protein [bacterium]